jgi:hypothetical protein
MVNIIEKQNERMNTCWLNRPVSEVSRNDFGDAELLPAMFTRPHAAGPESKARRSTGKNRFSPAVIALVLIAFAPVQAALLMSSFQVDGEQAIEDALVLAQKGAVQAVNLISIPTAEAAIILRQKSSASERVPSFNDGQWPQTLDTFKRLLAEQKASQALAAQTANEQLMHNLEAWMNAKASSGSSYR